jgi:hypothetical protein
VRVHIILWSALPLTALLSSCGGPAQAVGEGGCLTVSPEFVIDGGAEGFHRLSGLASGPEGQLLVLDGGDKRVIAYDSAGREVWRRGREGEGPGEMRQPDGISYVDGMVVVRDHGTQRLSFWSAAGDLLGTTPLSEFGFAGYPGWVAPLSSHRVVAMTMPRLRPGSAAGLPGAVVIGTRSIPPLDTVATFSFPAPLMVQAGPVALPVMPDFAAYPQVTSSPQGHIYVSPDGGYRIERLSAAGQPLHTIVGPPEGPPFTAADRERFIGRLPAGARAEDLPFPRFLPAVAGLAVSVEGDLLVRTHFRAGETVRWDRWTSGGDYVASMMLPAQFANVAVRGRRLAVIQTDSLDVPAVGIYRVVGRTSCAGPLPGG